MLKQLFKKSLFSEKENKQSSLDKRLIEKIIKELEDNPDCFTSRWSKDTSMESSLCSKNNEILIYISDLFILRPKYIEATPSQKEVIRKLIEPILQKDEDYIINSFKGACNK